LVVVDGSTQPSFHSLLQDVGFGQVKEHQIGPESLSQSSLLSFYMYSDISLKF